MIATAAMRTIAPSSSGSPSVPVAVLGAAHAERAADVVAARVARGGLLRERLQRRIDRQVDRVADVDRRAVDDDAVARAGAAGAAPRVARRSA